MTDGEPAIRRTVPSGIVEAVLDDLGIVDSPARAALCGSALVGTRSIAHTQVPFLQAAIARRSVSLVSLPDISPAFEDLRVTPLRHIRTIRALVLEDVPTIVRLWSAWPEGAPPLAPYPPVWAEEVQQTAVSERYVDLPPCRPAIGLLRVLKILEVEGFFSSEDVKQVIADNVVQRSVEFGPRHVWIVQARGLPPITPVGQAARWIPEDARNHLRSIVDASSGVRLYTDNVPNPLRPGVSRTYSAQALDEVG